MAWRKVMNIAALVGLGLLVALASYAQAKRVNPPDPLSLIRAFECTVAGYGKVEIVSAPTLNNLAMAERIAGSNRLIINIRTDFMKLFKPTTRLFWLRHECAHHTLGHTKRTARVPDEQLGREEDAADCEALKVLLNPSNPVINGDGLRVIQHDLARLPGGRYYTNGTQRAQRMAACAIKAGY